MNGFVNGLRCAPVMRLYPEYADFFFDTAGTHTFTVPRGAKRMRVTCIGGGGGGGEGGVTYGDIASAYPAGGGGGGSGVMAHSAIKGVSAGETYTLVVGAGGAAQAAGGASSFADWVSAAGGRPGETGGHEPLAENVTANGGAGGAGGIGGTGGGPGRGMFSHNVGVDGAYGASSLSWNTWTAAQWYVFEDETCKKRLGQGGAGGWGFDNGTYGHQGAQGASVSLRPGTVYGSGGRGGDQQKTGVTKTPKPGGSGLVAVRVYYRAEG